MGALLIKGGRVVDPATGVDGPRDVLLEGGRVAEVGARLAARGVEALDASGLVVCPGFIDLHVHLREPGDEHKETVASGTAAAAAGGFTAVCAQPDTRPANDGASVTRFLLERARAEGRVRVHPVGALTQAEAGERLAELGELRAAGCVAVSDGDQTLRSARLLRRALEYARLFELPVVTHCEDGTLAEGAQMHEGPVSGALGLRGAPAVAEVLVVERDLLLAELTGARLHLGRLSAAASVEALRRAKARGVRVTAGVTPHHLLLTEEAVRTSGYDSATRVSPPLRSEADRRGLLEGLRDGTLDCIVSDHAPHAPEDKQCEFEHAAPGIVGLETTVALCLDRLVRPGLLELPALVARLSTAPARAFGLPGGTLAPGAPADLTLLDLDARRVVDPARFASRGRATPFAGQTLQGGPAATIVGGRVVWQASR